MRSSWLRGTGDRRHAVGRLPQQLAHCVRLAVVCALFAATPALAATPIALFRSHAGSSRSADVDSLAVDDPFPPELELYVNGFGGPSPVRFVNGVAPSGLSLVLSGLGSGMDGVERPCSTPVDTTRARAIRIRPSGTFAGATPTTTPSFELRFRVRVK